jgi:hypothetical protein
MLLQKISYIHVTWTNSKSEFEYDHMLNLDLQISRDTLQLFERLFAMSSIS